MATTYNIEINQYNGVDYDVLYPKTMDNNVLLSDSVAEHFAITGDTSDAAFMAIPRIIIGTSTTSLPPVVNGAILIAYDA